MIETRRLKNVVNFFQTILSFVLSRKIRDTKYIYRNELDKVLRNKAFNIAKNPKYDVYQTGLASMAYKFLIKGLLVEQLNLCQIIVVIAFK